MVPWRRAAYVILAVLLMLATFALFFWRFQLPASASAARPSATSARVLLDDFLITKPELARIRAAGATAGFQWVACDPRRPSHTGCPVPTFTSYYEFARWVAAGGHDGATVLIDYENSVTPHWQMTHLMRYIRLAGELGAMHAMFTIFSPVTSPATVPTSMLAADEQAARYGDAVDIQLQWMEQHPARYAALLADWVPRIRAASGAGPGVVVLAGLATDPMGHPVTPWVLTRTFNLTWSTVDGYWLNVHPWPGRPGCAPQGCPQVAVEFLARIGA